MNKASNYMFFHGWVDDVVKGARAATICIRIRLTDGRFVYFDLGAADSPIRVGDEVSVAVDWVRPDRALVFMNHTTGEGMNYLRRDEDRWPTEGDVFITGATAGAFAALFGWIAVPTTLAVALLFRLVTVWLPNMRRQRVAARVDYLIDREYCRWRAGIDRQGTMW